MSREFGDYHGGYFHDKIRNAADDCASGRDKLTKLWGEFLNEFQPIAYAISSCEACDSGPDYPIFETMDRHARLKDKLDEIGEYILPFKRVAEEAVRKEAEKKK